MKKQQDAIEYEYWFAGMKKPKRLPKGCEMYQDVNKNWMESTHDPKVWTSLPRRWPKREKVCMWTLRDGKVLARSPHDVNGYMIKDYLHYCPTCGRKVKIVKGGEG